MPPSRVATFLVTLTATAALAGCGTDMADEGDDEPTPDQAYAAMEDALRAVLSAVVPGTDPGTVEGAEVPCGGLGGNEFNRVRRNISGGVLPEDDADAVLARAESAIGELGLESRGLSDVPAGPQLGFEGDGFVVSLVLRGDGSLTASGETECLDKPDR